MTVKQKAEEYVKEKACKDCYNDCENTLENKCFEYKDRYDGFIDGYHEGFKDCAKSRLNVTTISDCPIKDEWHYVKNEGTPTKEGHYLVCLRNKDHDIFECWIFVENNVAYSLKVRMKDIIAWQEITPPKEIE